jgi:hypothetical protein
MWAINLYSSHHPFFNSDDEGSSTSAKYASRALAAFVYASAAADLDFFFKAFPKAST